MSSDRENAISDGYRKRTLAMMLVLLMVVMVAGPMIAVAENVSDPDSNNIPPTDPPITFAQSNNTNIKGVQGVVLNEINTGGADWVELYNYGPDQVMSGWTWYWQDERGFQGTYIIPGGFVLPQYGFVVIYEFSGVNDGTHLYMSNNMMWTQSNSGGIAGALIDNGGVGIDYFRFAGSTDTPPAGTNWNLPDAPYPIINDCAYRHQDIDTDSGPDWAIGGANTPHALNPGQTGTLPEYQFGVTPPIQTRFGWMGDYVDHYITIQNTGMMQDVYLPMFGPFNWRVKFWNLDRYGEKNEEKWWIGPVAPGGTLDFIAEVRVPRVVLGDMDQVTITVTSHGDGTVMNNIDIITRTSMPTPFYDDFEEAGTSGNFGQWNDGGPLGTVHNVWTTDVPNRADVNDMTAWPPSTYSMYTQGGPVAATSCMIHMDDIPTGIASCAIQRGGGFSEVPDGGEDLVIEYLDRGRGWNQLGSFPGAGAPGETFYPLYTLPPDALHPRFQLRFRQLGGNEPLGDYWHIDNVYIGPPTPNFDLTPDNPANNNGMGNPVEYIMQIQNNADHADIYQVTTQGNWPSWGPGTPLGPVAPGDVIGFSVFVDIPAGLPDGAVDTTNIIATSQLDPFAFTDTSVATTTYGEPTPMLTPDTAQFMSDAGTTAEYVMNIENGAIFADTFDLGAVGGFPGPTTEIWNAAGTVQITQLGPLAAGANQDFLVRQEVPPGSAGTQAITLVTATSQANPLYFDVSALTTYATPNSLWYDNFEDGDVSDWTEDNSGGGDGDVAIYAPGQGCNSGVWSMFTRWDPVIMDSPVVPLNTYPNVGVGYWVQRGDDAWSEDVDDGEDLIVEYLNDVAIWTQLDHFLGGAPYGFIFEPIHQLPADALHTGFQLRFRQTSGSGFDYDYWHVDDVRLYDGLVVEQSTISIIIDALDDDPVTPINPTGSGGGSPVTYPNEPIIVEDIIEPVVEEIPEEPVVTEEIPEEIDVTQDEDIQSKDEPKPSVVADDVATEQSAQDESAEPSLKKSTWTWTLFPVFFFIILVPSTYHYKKKRR